MCQLAPPTLNNTMKIAVVILVFLSSTRCISGGIMCVMYCFVGKYITHCLIEIIVLLLLLYNYYVVPGIIITDPPVDSTTWY